jgi:hypothetical protein
VHFIVGRFERERSYEKRGSIVHASQANNCYLME